MTSAARRRARKLHPPQPRHILSAAPHRTPGTVVLPRLSSNSLPRWSPRWPCTMRVADRLRRRWSLWRERRHARTITANSTEGCAKVPPPATRAGESNASRAASTAAPQPVPPPRQRRGRRRQRGSRPTPRNKGASRIGGETRQRQQPRAAALELPLLFRASEGHRHRPEGSSAATSHDTGT